MIFCLQQAVLLYTDPEGEKVFTESQPATSHFTIPSELTCTEDSSGSMTVADLKAKIAELQKQLTQLEVQEYHSIQ